MARFCTECGHEIRDGIAFCTECGNKVPGDAPQVTGLEVNPGIMTEEQPKANVYAPPVPTEPAPQSSPPPRWTAPPPEPENKVVGTGAYFGLMLLFAHPVVACPITDSKRRTIP